MRKGLNEKSISKSQLSFVANYNDSEHFMFGNIGILIFLYTRSYCFI